jgi:hypothetical protein
VSEAGNQLVEGPGLRLKAPGGATVLEVAGRVRGYLARGNAWTALLLYTLLAMIWDRASVAHMSSVCSCGLPGDPAQYVWAFDWYPHALLHGLDPLYSKAMWTPTGLNLAGTGSVPFLAFVLAPVTLLWGPIVSLNVIIILAPILSAWSAYWLCRYVTKASWPSILAGIAYGFSTYEATELSGHLHLAVVFCLPLIVLCLLRALDGTLSRRQTVIWLTVLLLVQMYISTEVLLTMTVLAVVLVVAGWIFGSKDQRARIAAVVPLIVAAYVITVLVSSWYVYELLKAPAYAKFQGLFYPTDVLAFFIPNPSSWLGGSTFAPVTSLYVGGTGETLVYSGIPMLLVALRFIFTRWKRAATKTLTVGLILSVGWILGISLTVAGKSTIWLPYSLFYRLPLLNEVMQGRVALEFSLLLTVILAIWLAESAKTGRVLMHWAVALLAVAFVVPNFGSHPSSTWTNPTFFRTAMYKQYLKKGETIMPIAWGGFSESPMWQAEDHMYWNMANGYFMFPPPAGWQNQLTADLWADTPQATDAALLRPFVVKRGVSEIVVQSSELQRWSPTLRQAGLRADATIGGVTLYKVPSSWRASGRAA